MKSEHVRKSFFDFFKSKQHQITHSAPMVIKDDPTLMFTNAGMNQFKDIFLGNFPAKYTRVANTQKCLRVSGKHNDLEEVGHDTYHHTMFEMLGNWSFGDYFKKEAIDWAWELLVNVLKIPKDKLYATVFEGDEIDGTRMDEEAFEYWKQYLPEKRILKGNKKDNFWEMGDTGPCGPCSEVHIDIRDDAERAKKYGSLLVNKDHPEVIEIWNLVFIQFDRNASGKLVELPAKHVDTGMGFERLCMVLQGKRSNYDTDIFQPIIRKIADLSGKTYGDEKKADTAMRVVADHLRAIAFAIADGQLPSNNKAGYVIRRILRRAVRYGYTFLGFRDPFIHSFIPTLIESMGEAFPELGKQQELIEKVIKEEESLFLSTIESGSRMLDSIIEDTLEKDCKVVSGSVAFELYDTFGFPLDLTELVLKERSLAVNIKEFNETMEAQKARSRNATQQEAGDWIILSHNDREDFTGYDHLDAHVKIIRYRKVKSKNREYYQLVLSPTPFYGESGGQVGDTGHIEANGEKIKITDTKKENNLTVHYTNELPGDPAATFVVHVDKKRRQATANNHSATHLLGYALRAVLGEHIEQKGSLVTPDYLRFDFSHYQKLTQEELDKVQHKVNRLIRENIKREEFRDIPSEQAKDMGAVALFGEKYGDLVRVIKFGSAVELCAGTHVEATGNIGQFLITTEGSISAGIRRIEAITAEKAEKLAAQSMKELRETSALLSNPDSVKNSVSELLSKVHRLTKEVDLFEKQSAITIKNELLKEVEVVKKINFIAKKLQVKNSGVIKDIAFQLKGEVENLFLLLGAEIDGKANIQVMISDSLVKDKNMDASKLIQDMAKEIKGGGGGQAFYATAGGREPDGIRVAIQKAREIVEQA